MTPKYRIVHTDLTDSSQIDITAGYDLDIQEGIKASMDTFQFRIIQGAKPSRTFEINDGIDIYMEDTSGTPTTLVINGIITELNYETQAEAKIISISGVNRVERLLFSPRPAVYAADFARTDANSASRTGWSAVVTHLIDKANAFKATGDSTLITYDTTSIPDLGNLPARYDFDWKSIYEHLETLSTPEWAPNKKEYFIELDTTNKLYFRSKEDSPYNISSGTISVDTGFINVKVRYGLFDVINAVLLNCGKDTDGNSILVVLWDSSSMGLYGAKFKYIKEETIASKYLTEGGGSVNPVTDQRDDIKEIGKRRINEIIRLLGQPKYKITGTILGTTSYTKGKIYLCTSSAIEGLGTIGRHLRITNLMHRFNTGGWLTSIELEQDAKTIELESS